MVAKDSEIKAPRAFAPDFETHRDALSSQVARDTRVQWILRQLNQAEVSSSAASRTHDQPFVAPQPYPLWYYVGAARRLYRRRWRQQLHSAATPDHGAR